MSSNAPSWRGDAPSFVHLRRLTDDTGLLEHALGRIPRRREGYTTDDNARALWTVTEWLDPRRRKKVREEDVAVLRSLADVYLAFLLWTQKDDGWFHNNIAYDRTPEPEEVSHDCQGRALWSCADAWVRLDCGQRETAYVLIQKSMRTIGAIGSLRGRAFAMAACAHLIEADNNGVINLPDGWKDELSDHLVRYERILCDAFRQFSQGDWNWFEPAMTYSNGVLPWAMLRAFRVTGRTETLEIGLDCLSSLLTAMKAESGHYRPIGNEKWRTKEAVSYWDQQPLEMFKLALSLEEGAIALEAAQGEGVSLLVSNAAASDVRHHSRHGTMTAERKKEIRIGDSRIVTLSEHAEALRKERNACLAWFYGNNDLCAQMVDPSEGCCCDGLQENGPNLNCGAEATLSYLMTQALCSDDRG
ncbi:hypothetical protein [Cohnella zeiphila]|uniref:Glycosyltransferase n=1 Tax=Cohnella zeiphila TaxID=2761120 RepID=A0A7X0SL31_9BACL|nr:hypothetical protein [Cohnella zeiphila]MBB6731983.1 hypothetical protein [Cohnella zeiphila]